MTPAEITIFNAAVELANQGEKQNAHAQLRVLENANPAEVSLLLWLAFTAPSLEQSEALLMRANALDPANPNLVQAKNWLAQEKAKKAPPVVQPAPVALTSYNYNWPASFPGGPTPYGMPPAQPSYNPYQQPPPVQPGYGYYNPAMSGYPTMPYAPLNPQPQVKKLGFWKGFAYYLFYFVVCGIALVVIDLIMLQISPTYSAYMGNGRYVSGQDSTWATVVNLLITGGSAIWATVDATNRRNRYGKEANSHPAVILLGCIFLWIFFFPAYLVQRHRQISTDNLLANSWDGYGQRF